MLIPYMYLTVGQGQGVAPGFWFIDSTPAAVWRPQSWSRKAHKPRRHLPHFFAGQAPWSNRSSGWFFGCKRPGVFTHPGLWLNAALTPDNVALSPPVSGLVGDRVRPRVADGGALFCKRGTQRQGLLALPLRPKRGIQREKATPADGRPVPAARRVFIEIRINPRQNSAPIDPTRPRSRPFLGSISSADALFMATNPKNRPQNRAKSRKKAPFSLVIQSLFGSIGRRGLFFGSNFLVFGFNFPVIGT